MYREYQRKVSIVALSGILASGNYRISSIVVKGEEIIVDSKSTEGIRTRSKMKDNPSKYTIVSK